MRIDFVIPWVNGSDPDWLAVRNEYCRDSRDIDESRYRDWDILRFWFRAAEKYSPWVDRIHFITCGQIPSWLNKTHPKLHLVDHTDFIPAEYLPTFNSMTIELNFHRIPGLSDYFVYFNDDMFLNAPTTPDDFFVNGLPRATAVMTPLTPAAIGDAHIHAICNNMAFINTHFQKKEVLRSSPLKWYNPKYGKGLIKNVLNTPGSLFSCFSNPHICSSMRKTTYEKVWNLAPDLLDHSCRNRFRTTNSINQYIMTYFDLCTGNFIPRNPSIGVCYEIGIDSAAMHQDIRTGKHKIICVNDNANVVDFQEEQAMLIHAFESVLPHKSSFEL